MGAGFGLAREGDRVDVRVEGARVGLVELERRELVGALVAEEHAARLVEEGDELAAWPGRGLGSMAAWPGRGLGSMAAWPGRGLG